VKGSLRAENDATMPCDYDIVLLMQLPRSQPNHRRHVRQAVQPVCLRTERQSCVVSIVRAGQWSVSGQSLQLLIDLLSDERSTSIVRCSQFHHLACPSVRPSRVLYRLFTLS